MNATRSLNSTLDRVVTLSRRLRPGPRRCAYRRTRLVPHNVVEKNDAYVLYADLAGVDASAVNITFEQNAPEAPSNH